MASTTASPLPFPNTGTTTHTPNPSSNDKEKDKEKRIEIGEFIKDFQKLLGNEKWEKYKIYITKFLIGKITRIELEEELNGIFTSREVVQFHNKFLLINLTNALQQDLSAVNTNSANGWTTKSTANSTSNSASSEVAKLKKDILSLSIRERKRIKEIAKLPPNIPKPTISQTRQTMLPHIPINTEEPAANTPNLAHELVTSYEAPLISEIYEIFDINSLQTKISSILIENGLSSSVHESTLKLILTSLEFYLRDLIQKLFAHKSGHSQDSSPVTIEDLNFIIKASNNLFVELNTCLYNLNDRMMRNDDEMITDTLMSDEDPKDNTEELDSLLMELINEPVV